ncbi:hypothetical protein KSS87_000293 [Heliosperma pusillum]|nr:hypothetical protein KSS87_000293 [Heliosperma pusillum]
MSPRKISLADLSDDYINFTVTTTLDSMLQPKLSRNGKTKLQKLLFTDTSGVEMAATIFDQDIAFFEEKFYEGKEYEITNPIVKAFPNTVRRGNHKYQMIIKYQTQIVETCPVTEGHTSYVAPLNSTHDHLGHEGRLDIVAIVVLLSGARKVTSSVYDKEIDARDLILVDKILTPVTLTVWRQPLVSEIEQVSQAIDSFPVVHITRLHFHAEGCWNTSSYSSIMLNSVVSEADELRVWVHDNISSIESVRSDILAKKVESSRKKVDHQKDKEIVVAASSIAEMENNVSTAIVQNHRIWPLLFRDESGPINLTLFDALVEKLLQTTTNRLLELLPEQRTSVVDDMLLRARSEKIAIKMVGFKIGDVNQQKNKYKSFSLKECAISIALVAGLLTGTPAQAITFPALPDLAVLISGPPIKDPGALLRYALPIDNKPIREVQKPLEDITDSLKVSGLKALDSVERNLKQASRTLKNGKPLIVAGLAESKKEHGLELLDKLEVGMRELQQIVEDRNRDAVVPKQKELLQYVGSVEEDMVDGFPYEVPEEYRNMPLLKGRAAVDMKVKVKDNPNFEQCIFHIVLDGYNAPVTAGNFVDLVERHFYDGMEIQRADGFVVQTGDPEGPAEGFIDPSTEKPRTIPLELMVEGEKAPFYGATLEELGLYKAQTKLPFNAFGTMAMAREEFENNSGSSQVFWLLKESELTPSNANILDGRYAVFGYVTENEDYLADLKVGDVIESIQVVSGLDNLVNPTYKIAG